MNWTTCSNCHYYCQYNSCCFERGWTSISIFHWLWVGHVEFWKLLSVLNWLETRDLGILENVFNLSKSIGCRRNKTKIIVSCLHLMSAKSSVFFLLHKLHYNTFNLVTHAQISSVPAPNMKIYFKLCMYKYFPSWMFMLRT